MASGVPSTAWLKAERGPARTITLCHVEPFSVKCEDDGEALL